VAVAIEGICGSVDRGGGVYRRETRRSEAVPALGDVEIWGVFGHGKALGGLIDVGGHTAMEIPTRRRFRGTRTPLCYVRAHGPRNAVA